MYIENFPEYQQIQFNSAYIKVKCIIYIFQLQKKKISWYIDDNADIQAL